MYRRVWVLICTSTIGKTCFLLGTYTPYSSCSCSWAAAIDTVYLTSVTRQVYLGGQRQWNRRLWRPLARAPEAAAGIPVAGASPWECRAARGHQARPEEAQEPSCGAAKEALDTPGALFAACHAARAHPTNDEVVDLGVWAAASVGACRSQGMAFGLKARLHGRTARTA